MQQDSLNLPQYRSKHFVAKEKFPNRGWIFAQLHTFERSWKMILQAKFTLEIFPF